jgi:transporter family-2 protein
MYRLIAPLVGALITLMYGLNSRLSGTAGNLVATLAIHVAGLAGVSALLLARPEERRGGRLPFYYYLGGFVGVGTVFASNYAYGAIDASLAVALGLIGQTLFSIAVDSSGFLGRARYPLTPRRIPGICLALAGAAVLAGNWLSAPLAMLAALVSGALPVLSVSLNSELGRRKGILRSTRVNYIVGLLTVLVMVAFVRPPAAASLRALAMAGPFLALGGGLMGVAVVAATNLVFPRMPAFSAMLLMFSGQALAGVLVDFAAAGSFDGRKLLGTMVVLAGLGLDGLLAKRPEPAAAA